MKKMTALLILLLKVPSFLFARFWNFISLNAFNVTCETYPIISGRLLLKGKGKVKIGRNVIINSSLNSNPVGLVTQTVIFAYKDSEIVIGNNVGISNSLLCSMAKIVIEDDVLIGGGVQIFDNDFHSILYRQRMEQQNTNINMKPVTIKKGAFIGCNAIIGKGITVGERSIVAAGSVIVNNIPDDEIWAEIREDL